MSSKLALCLTVIALALPLAGQVALAEEMNLNQARAECQKRPQNCGNMAGAALEQCLLNNGRIQHACNIARAGEHRGGCDGTRCR